MKTFVVGDVHGRCAQLHALLKMVPRDEEAFERSLADAYVLSRSQVIDARDVAVRPEAAQLAFEPIQEGEGCLRGLGGILLVAVRGRIQALIDQGMSEDEVVAAKPTAEFDAAWGQGFMNPENFTRFSYQSLKK